jgi:hypothetical protein
MFCRFDPSREALVAATVWLNEVSDPSWVDERRQRSTAST